MSKCCVTGFEWDEEPKGHTIPFPTTSNQAYVTGTSSSAAILFICDLFGWQFRNNRLLADHLARDVGATVYVPDFFNNDPLPADILTKDPPWPELNLDVYLTAHSREARSPEILACARHLRSQYHKLGAIGYCYGGWASFYLASEDLNPPNSSEPPLLDCLTIGHPSLLTEADIEAISSSVAVQVLAPEFDAMYPTFLKKRTWQVLQRKNVPFEYRHFPGVEHACFVRGDPNKAGERDAMEKGLRSAVGWMGEWLGGDGSFR